MAVCQAFVYERHWLLSQISPTSAQFCLMYLFISLLFMFWASTCSSSGEIITVSMRHWYLSLCMGGVWSAGWTETAYVIQVFWHLVSRSKCSCSQTASKPVWHTQFQSNQQTKRHPYRVTNTSVAQIQQFFSRGWAHGCPKHVEKRNK